MGVGPPVRTVLPRVSNDPFAVSNDQRVVSNDPLEESFVLLVYEAPWLLRQPVHREGRI